MELSQTLRSVFSTNRRSALWVPDEEQVLRASAAKQSYGFENVQVRHVAALFGLYICITPPSS